MVGGGVAGGARGGQGHRPMQRHAPGRGGEKRPHAKIRTGQCVADIDRGLVCPKVCQQAYGECESWEHVCWHRQGGIGEVWGQGVGEPWAGEKRRGKSWPAGGSKMGVEVGCKRRLTKMVVFEMGFRGACAGRWGYSGVGWGKGDVCEGCVPPPNCSERSDFGPFGTIHITHPQPTYSTLHDVSENFQHPNSFFLWNQPLAEKKMGG